MAPPFSLTELGCFWDLINQPNKFSPKICHNSFDITPEPKENLGVDAHARLASQREPGCGYPSRLGLPKENLDVVPMQD